MCALLFSVCLFTTLFRINRARFVHGEFPLVFGLNAIATGWILFWHAKMTCNQSPDRIETEWIMACVCMMGDSLRPNFARNETKTENFYYMF